MPWEGPGSLRKVWNPAEVKKLRIHRSPKREKASDKHKLIDINVNKWVIFKEIASRGPWEPRRTQTCLIKGVWLSKGKIVTTCERNGVGLRILANNFEIRLYQLICKGILEGCGRYARMSEDALRTWETILNFFQMAYGPARSRGKLFFTWRQCEFTWRQWRFTWRQCKPASYMVTI